MDKNAKRLIIENDGQHDPYGAAMNLAFDVTPAKYVTGLITESGISEASSEGLKKLFK